jgi:hypothetical protein
MTALDDLHLAMGRFLSESSEVETMMWVLFGICQQERSFPDAFNYFLDQTFGAKIAEF